MPKARGNGEGSIRQRPDGTWEARYYVDGKQKSIYAKTRNDVKTRLGVILVDIERKKQMERLGIVPLESETKKPPEMTVGELLEEWWSGYIPKQVKPMTLSQYGTQIHYHLIPAFGELKLRELDAARIQRFMNGVTGRNGKLLSAKSVSNLLHVLHGALEYAVDMEYITKNPSSKVKPPKRVKKHDIRPLERAERPLFREAIKGDPYERVFRVLLGTGMREGEILGLRWQDIDFERGCITVSTQLQRDRSRGGQYYLATTKNGKERTFYPAAYVMSELRKQKAEQNAMRLKTGSLWENAWNLVFTEWNGRYIVANTMRNHFFACAASIGRRDLRVHDLRHTFAVISLEQGVDYKTLSETLGHATVAFTLDIYCHVSEKMQRDASEKLDSAFAELWG